MARSPSLSGSLEPTLPTDDEIVEFCRLHKHPPNRRDTGASYPLAAGGSIWIKFGDHIQLSEAWTQRWVYERIDILSCLRVPRVFHAFQDGDTAYIVMEEVKGETVEQLVKRSPDEIAMAVRKIGCALDHFIRIHPPEGTYLGPVGGGVMQHLFFLDGQAATRYDSKEALENHINMVLQITRDHLEVDFTNDQRIVWPADFHGSNFKIVDDLVYWLDFQHVNVLPESFKVYGLESSWHWIARHLCRKVLHGTEAEKASTPYLSSCTSAMIANTVALIRASMRMKMSGRNDLGLDRLAKD